MNAMIRFQNKKNKKENGNKTIMDRMEMKIS
jgi:hypothetical protein